MNSTLRHYILMLISLLLFLSFFASCDEQDKTKDSPAGIKTDSKQSSAPQPERKLTDVKESKKVNPVDLPESSLPVEDPTFVMSKDTISKHGPRSITRNILQSRNGDLWFASWEGIINYEPEAKLFTNVTLKEGLRHFRVFSILEDKTGNIWVGTVDGGMYRYDPSNKSFDYFTAAHGLTGNAIFCMLEDKYGNIWFGTDKGVSRYDPSNYGTDGKIFTNFTTKDGLGSDFVSSIIQDKDGKLWFGTNGGVSIYDPSASHKTGEKFFTDFKNEKGSSFYLVRDVMEDKAGNIWIGSAGGLCRYDRAKNETGERHFTDFPANLAINIFEDKAGNIWLSEGIANSAGMNLSRFDGAGFIKIKNDKQIFGVTEDKTGNIWFGTVNGALRYDGISFTGFTD